MSKEELLQQMRCLSIVDRLAVIEAATRSVYEEMAPHSPASDQEHRLRTAAVSVKDLYETGSELTEWTSLDSEEFIDDHAAR